MKRIKTFKGLMVLLFLPVLLFAYKGDCPFALDKFDLDLDEESIVLKSDLMPGTVVRIDEDYRLFINDEPVSLTEEEEHLVALYYEQAMSLVLNAKKIGIESAKFALETVAKAGAQGIYAAIVCLFDNEKAETHLKKVEQEIELKARDIEERAKKVEKLAKKLEALHCRLFYEVEALRNLILEN